MQRVRARAPATQRPLTPSWWTNIYCMYFQTDALCGMGNRTRYFSTTEPHGRGRPLQPRTADMLHALVSQRGIPAVRSLDSMSTDRLIGTLKSKYNNIFHL